MLIKTDDDYRELLALVFRYVEKKGLRALTDPTEVPEFEFDYLPDEKIAEVQWSDFRRRYPIREIKLCRSYAIGLLLVFQDGYYLLLPVSGDDQENAELVLIAQLLYNAMPLRFNDVERLYIPEPQEKIKEKSKKRSAKKKTGNKKKVAVDSAHLTSQSPVMVFVVVLLALGMATAFVMMPNANRPIAREELGSVTGRLAKWDIGHEKYNSVELEDGSDYPIPTEALSSDVEQRLNTIPVGTEITLLVRPTDNYAVEISANGTVCMDADVTQARMLRESKYFFWMGIAVYACCPLLVGYAVFQMVQEKRHNKQRRTKR